MRIQQHLREIKALIPAIVIASTAPSTAIFLTLIAVSSARSSRPLSIPSIFKRAQEVSLPTAPASTRHGKRCRPDTRLRDQYGFPLNELLVAQDKSGANLAALHAVNARRETPIRIRQRKCLNNILE
jgi:hypothetical protein